MTTTTTTTRHSARCDCGSFCVKGETMCPSCIGAYERGNLVGRSDMRQMMNGQLTDAEKQRDAAREAAVADHAAHDAELARMREERDRAISERNMAAQSDDMLRVAAQQAAAQAISQRDQAVYDAERLARWLGYAIAAAITGALAAIAGWVR